MNILKHTEEVPIYSLEPDEATGNKNFRVYNFEGTLPPHDDLLIPHRKDHYLVIFMRQGGSRQWIDTTPYVLKDKTVYFLSPGQIIVKEGTQLLWSTGIAFTKEFLTLQENDGLQRLPLLQNRHNVNELLLSDSDVVFVEDVLSKINHENGDPGEWQQQMLSAYLVIFLTYLSRLYTQQYSKSKLSADTLLLRKFHAKIDECYKDLHEVANYASMLNISAGHLSEVVKEQSGKPAIKHIHERLVLEARRLLFHTNHSLKEIAFKLGFADASYFNRFFKRETGITPVDFRDSTRKMYH